MFEDRISVGFLLTVNATIIAGIFILLAIGSTTTTSYWLWGEYQIATNAVISLLLIPFVYSTAVLLKLAKPDLGEKEKEESYNDGVKGLRFGVITMFFFLFFFALFSLYIPNRDLISG